jgi:hypothetical protein
MIPIRDKKICINSTTKEKKYIKKKLQYDFKCKKQMVPE